MTRLFLKIRCRQKQYYLMFIHFLLIFMGFFVQFLIPIVTVAISYNFHALASGRIHIEQACLQCWVEIKVNTSHVLQRIYSFGALLKLIRKYSECVFGCKSISIWLVSNRAISKNFISFILAYRQTYQWIYFLPNQRVRLPGGNNSWMS